MLVEHSRSLEKSTKLAYSFNTFPIFSWAVIFATLIPYKLLPFDKVVVTLVLMLLDLLLFQCIGFHTKVTFLTPGRSFSNKVYKVVVTLVKILLKNWPPQIFVKFSEMVENVTGHLHKIFGTEIRWNKRVISKIKKWGQKLW